MSYPIIGDSTVLHSPPVKNKRGPVAQLGARTVRIRKVGSSILLFSTSFTKSALFTQCGFFISSKLYAVSPRLAPKFFPSIAYELLKNFCGRYPLSWYHENAGFAQSGTT